MIEEIVGRLPTIPEYYKRHINQNVDLDKEPKQCSPWRKETSPSFSYSREKNVWRDFGRKVGGGVVDLHMIHYNIASREEAEKSLKAMYKVYEKIELKKLDLDYIVDDTKIYSEQIYQRTLLLANNVERWLELDYCMSKTPVDATELELLISKWTGKVR